MKHRCLCGWPACEPYQGDIEVCELGCAALDAPVGGRSGLPLGLCSNFAGRPYGGAATFAGCPCGCVATCVMVSAGARDFRIADCLAAAACSGQTQNVNFLCSDACLAYDYHGIRLFLHEAEISIAMMFVIICHYILSTRVTCDKK